MKGIHPVPLPVSCPSYHRAEENVDWLEERLVKLGRESSNFIFSPLKETGRFSWAKVRMKWGGGLCVVRLSRTGGSIHTPCEFEKYVL